MAYNQNIPQPADQLKNSQPQFLANFQEINTYLSVNHVGFNVGDQGKHKFIQFPQQLVDATTSASEYAQYSKQGLYSASTEMVFRTPSDTSITNITEKRYTASDGWWQLPSGIIVKYIKANIPNTNNVNALNFDFLWPVANTIPFTQTPFNYYFTFLGVTNQNIRLFASVDTTLTTALHFYGRLSAATAASINITSFDILVTAYGI